MNLLRLIQINKNKIQFKYLIIALLIWYSIGAKFSDIYIFELTLASLANFFKSLINILFPLTIFVIIFYKKYFINFLKSEYLFLILYFIIQIFYIFNNPNLNELLLNIFIPEKILSLSNEIKYGLELNAIYVLLMAISSIFFIGYFKEKKNIVKGLIISLILYLFLNLIYVIFLLNNFIIDNSLTSFYYTQQIKYGYIILDNITPRSTGLSRSLLLLATILSIFFIYKKKNRYNLFIFLLLIIINSFIFMLSSRFSIWVIPIVYVFLVFFLTNEKIKHFLIFTVILFSSYTISSKLYDFKVNEFLKSTKNINLPDRGSLGIFGLNHAENTRDKIIQYSSGRVTIWREGLNIFLNNDGKIFGLGHQSDRRYLHNLKSVNRFYGSNMSNGFLNALVSGGIIGLIFITIFNIIIIKKIYFLIKKEKILKIKSFENILIQCSIVIFFILNLRMLIENSYTVFGVDFLTYLICSSILINKLKYKNFYS